VSSVLAVPRITDEEYLALERKAQTKSELIHGYMHAMAGATREHNLVAFNVAGQFYAQLKGRPCEAYMGDMRVKVWAAGLYTYPDVVIACGDIQFEDAQGDTLLTPTVIIEVLSPSTEACDRGAKFAHYRRLPTLQEYVLIAQDRASVEHYLRQGDQWVLSEANDLAATVQLPTVGCHLLLSDVYDKVEFPEPELAPA